MTTHPMHTDGVSIAHAIDTAVAAGVAAAVADANSVRVITNTASVLATDIGSTILVTGANTFNLTIPPGLPTGNVRILNGSSGKVTLVATGPATVEGLLLGAGLILDAKATAGLSSGVADAWHLSGGAAT